MGGDNLERNREIEESFPSMRQILDSDIRHITMLLATIIIHYRYANSVNLSGTFLVIVAGTPDFNDLERLQITQQELIEFENKQEYLKTKTEADFK